MDQNDIAEYKELESRAEELCQKLLTLQTPDEIKQFFAKAKDEVLVILPKAKAAKTLRRWVDEMAINFVSDELQETLCKAALDWAEEGKRSFLKHRIEVRLCEIYLNRKMCTEALEYLAETAMAVKKMDEKGLLVEVYLLQARVYNEVQNIVKAKAALTACRTNANTVYVAPLLQAEIEVIAGILAAREGDFAVAHSYFLEAFDGFSHSKVENKLGTGCLKTGAYLLVTKLLDKKIQDFWTLAKGKGILPYTNTPIFLALTNVAHALDKQSLSDFVIAMESEEFERDGLIYECLKKLQDTMVEDTIVSLLQAYVRIDVPYIADRLQLPVEVVHRKIIGLILDERLEASIDESNMILSIHEPKSDPEMVRNAYKTIQNLTECVNYLHKIAQKQL